MPLYWPWWAGAVALAVVTVGCCVVARRPLGVSGILERFVNLREELAAQRTRAAADAAGDAALEAALLAATAEAFGPAAAVVVDAGAPRPQGALQVVATGGSEACGGECASPLARPTLAAHAMFLGAIVAGGFVVQVVRGRWAPAMDLGPTFAQVVGTGAKGAAALLVGGLLVGFGTSLGGGCSTGHGLSGCSRLQPAGVAATVAFMATAVAVSLLLAGSVSP